MSGSGEEGSDESGASTSRRTIGIHLLGRVDLRDVEPGGLRGIVAQLEDDATSRLVQNGNAPTARFLQAAALTDLWLVATDQTPPHPDDTAGLASLIADALAGKPSLYGGAIIRHEILVVERFGLAAFAERLRARCRDLPDDAGLVVAMGSGSTEAFLGIVVGCLQAGRRPQIAEITWKKALPEMAQPEPRTLEIDLDVDLAPWLIRSAAFTALPGYWKKEEKARVEAVDLLAAMERFDWESAATAAERALASDVPIRQPLDRLRRVVNGAEDADVPWGFLASVYASIILRRAVAGETCQALFLARPWIEAHARSLLEHDNEATSWNVALVSTAGAHEPSFHKLIASLGTGVVSLADLPRGALRGFLASTDDVWSAAADCDHGRPVSAPRTRRAVELVASVARQEADPFAMVLSDLDYPPFPLPTGSGWLVLEPVGSQDLQSGATPFNDSVVDFLKKRNVPLGESHLRLVHTRQTRTTAARINNQAVDMFSSVALIEVPVADLERAWELVREALVRDGDIEGVQEVLVLGNPGSKAMNLGTILAALQWGFDSRTRVQVGSLRKMTDGTSARLESAGRLFARLGHDAAVSAVAAEALRDLDFGLAADVLKVGSPIWDGLDGVVRLFARLATEPGTSLPVPPPDLGMGGLHDMGRRGAVPEARADADDLGWPTATAARLWPARTCLYQTLVHRDPWRTIYRLAAIAEMTWPGDPGGAPPWRDGQLLACHAIWDWRNQGPYGHEPAAPMPSRSDVRRSLRNCVGDLEANGLAPPTVDSFVAFVDETDGLEFAEAFTGVVVDLVRFRDCLVSYIEEIGRD